MFNMILKKGGGGRVSVLNRALLGKTPVFCASYLFSIVFMDVVILVFLSFSLFPLVIVILVSICAIIVTNMMIIVFLIFSFHKTFSTNFYDSLSEANLHQMFSYRNKGILLYKVDQRIKDRDN